MKKRLCALLLMSAIICTLAACDGRTPSKVNIDDTPQTPVADIVIVGAGGAGMTAGITAARAGKKVVIFEKTAAAGGSTLRSAEGMNAAGTEYQDDNGWSEAVSLERALSSAAREYPALKGLVEVVQKEYSRWKGAGTKGHFDSAGALVLDTMVSGKGINDLELVTTLAEHSDNAIDWLDSIGASLHSVGSMGGSVKRIHRPINEERKPIAVGPYLARALEQACIDNGVEMIFDTPVTEILTEDDRVVGVRTQDYIVNAKAVILATGGFGADLEMVAQWDPELEGLGTASTPGCTGDGIRMAQAVGADAVDMECIQIYPTTEQASSAPISESLRKDGAILVNTEGLRFCNETDSQDAVTAAILEQDGVWLILDGRIAKASHLFDDYEAAGYPTEGKDPSQLADTLGLPEDDFTETISRWNAAVTGYWDGAFGRSSFTYPLDTAPYYAIPVAPGIYHTMGGVKINRKAEVMDTDGQAIPGLFAAGEVTGGIHGAEQLEGNGITDAVVFGRIAGESAAAYTE